MVFMKNVPAEAPENYNVCVTLGRKPTKGHIGLEIEVEGNKFPKPPGANGTHTPTQMPDMPFWSYVHDGSLRGADNAEYLLTKPIDFAEAPKALNELFGGLTKYGTVIDESNRTSVHVHLNCQEFHFNRLTSFLALYFTLEELITEWCGPHRVGNLFCLRAKDAPSIITQLKKFIKTNGAWQINDHFHYAGLNPNALFKFGSLEVRTLRGVRDAQTVLDWLAILQRIYDLSAEFKDPREICGKFSSNGPLDFFHYILGDAAKILQRDVAISEDRIRDCMYDGIRMAQDLCFCRDWTDFKESAFVADPFGRQPKKSLFGTPGLSPGMAEYLSSQPTQGNSIESFTWASTAAPEPADPIGWETIEEPQWDEED